MSGRATTARELAALLALPLDELSRIIGERFPFHCDYCETGAERSALGTVCEYCRKGIIRERESRKGKK